MIKKFDKEYLTETLCLPWSKEYVVEDEIVDIGRWDVFHRLVFKDLDGTYWETEYWEGATEMQPEVAWEYDAEVECEQVVPRSVLVTKFVPVEEGDCWKMREPTPEERAAVDRYLRSISHATANDFFSFLIEDDMK